MPYADAGVAPATPGASAHDSCSESHAGMQPRRRGRPRAYGGGGAGGDGGLGGGGGGGGGFGPGAREHGGPTAAAAAVGSRDERRRCPPRASRAATAPPSNARRPAAAAGRRPDLDVPYSRARGVDFISSARPGSDTGSDVAAGGRARPLEETAPRIRAW